MDQRPYSPLTARERSRGGELDFRILGPLEVLDGDRLVALPGPRQRNLLAFLLLHPNQVVSSDRLLEELWPGEAPESGAATLQASVSRLRKALGPGAPLLVTAAPGYVLRLDSEQLDVRRFERLVEEAAAAEPAAAAELLREALGLWRGPALADLAFESFAQAAIARLEDLRLLAVERRIDADLALGQHARLVPELEALVAEHRLREGLLAQLMLAQYRAGRQAEALEHYRRARQTLVDELGIDPSPALQELEQAILRQDASLELERRAPKRRSILAVSHLGRGLEPLLALAEPLARKPEREIILAHVLGNRAELAGSGSCPEYALRRARRARPGGAGGRVHLHLGRSGHIAARDRAGRRPDPRHGRPGAARRPRPRRTAAHRPVRRGRRRWRRPRAGPRPRTLCGRRARLGGDRARRLARRQLEGDAQNRRALQSRAAATRAACSRAPRSQFSAP